MGGAAALPTREAYQIRRMLTEGAVRASDKRAQFVGIEAYEEAGGIVLRDLFQSDDGGWLQDPSSARPARCREAGSGAAEPCGPRGGSGSKSR